jgi:hypothetical protein
MDRSTFINALLVCLVNALFMVAGIFLNTVVVISLRRSTQLRNKLCYFAILLLSCFDLAVVAISHPVLILSAMFWSARSYNGAVKLIWEYTSIVFGGSSGFALLTLNIERFLALKYPFFHGSAVTKSRLVLFQSLFIMIIFSLSPLAYYYGRTVGNILIVVYIFCISSLFAYLNYNIFIIAKSKRRGESVAPSGSTTFVNDDERRKRKMDWKNISTCSIAVGCFFICSCPQLVYSLLRLTTDTLSQDKHSWIFNLWSNTFSAMNSTFNCLIFFWKHSILRREGMKTIKYFQFVRS